jgi:hypothetical protein
MNDDRVVRLRIDEARAFADLADNEQPITCYTVVGVTATDGAYPTMANSVYKCNTQLLDGDEYEGATVTFTADGQTVYAYNVGSQAPPQGTYVVIFSNGSRWQFRYDG